MVEREEFQFAVQLIREDIKGVHARLDLLNGRTREAEENIARLQERIKPQKSSVIRWGTLGGLVALMGKAVNWYWKR